MSRRAKLIQSGKPTRRGFGKAIVIGLGTGTVAVAILVVAIMLVGHNPLRSTVSFSKTPSRSPSAVQPTAKPIPHTPVQAVQVAERFAQAATTTEQGTAYGAWIVQVQSIVTPSYLRALKEPLGNTMPAPSTTTARVQLTAIARPPVDAQAAIDVVLSTRTSRKGTKAIAGNTALLVDLVQVDGQWLVSGFQQ